MKPKCILSISHSLVRLNLIVAIASLGAVSATATDWLTLPSTFTHSPATGARVRQYAPVDAPPINDQSQLVTGGFTHFRSTIQVGQSADNYHRTNQWGTPVRPYGEWRFPYRPYSAPYEAWGAPFAGLNLGFGGFNGVNVFPGQGGLPGQGGFPGQGGIPGQPINPYPPSGAFPDPPWFDGYYREAPEPPRMNDQDFYFRPPQ